MKPPPSDPLQKLLGRHWHHLPEGEVGRLLETNLESGLDLFAVKQRREQFGPNQLTPRQGQSSWLRFLLQFHNPLIYILLAAGGLFHSLYHTQFAATENVAKEDSLTLG